MVYVDTKTDPEKRVKNTPKPLPASSLANPKSREVGQQQSKRKPRQRDEHATFRKEKDTCAAYILPLRQMPYPKPRPRGNPKSNIFSTPPPLHLLVQSRLQAWCSPLRMYGKINAFCVLMQGGQLTAVRHHKKNTKTVPLPPLDLTPRSCHQHKCS